MPAELPVRKSLVSVFRCSTVPWLFNVPLTPLSFAPLYMCHFCALLCILPHYFRPWCSRSIHWHPWVYFSYACNSRSPKRGWTWNLLFSDMDKKDDIHVPLHMSGDYASHFSEFKKPFHTPYSASKVLVFLFRFG